MLYSGGMKLKQAIAHRTANEWATYSHPHVLESRLSRIVGIYGPDARISSIDPKRLIKWCENAGNQPGTIRGYLVVLKGLGVDVPAGRVADKEARCLSDGELAGLDERVRSQDSEKWGDCQAFYAVLRDTGMRGREEVSRSVVDWENDEVTTHAHKGSVSITRTIGLTSIARKGFAWLAHSGVPTDSQWRAFWGLVRLDAKNVPYDLRHTYCTRLFDVGVEAPVISKLMGHTNLERTLRYYHQSPNALRTAAAALESPCSLKKP